MSSIQKLSLVLVAALALGAAFALARSGSDDGDAATTTSTSPPGTTDGSSTGEAQSPTATAPAAPPRPAATLIRVRDGKPVGGVERVKVHRGDRVRLIISSDKPDEVHVHGYDLERPVTPGAPARFSFTADAEGVFDIELHSDDVQIAALEVQPA
jgi:hypothetical protein